MPKPQGFNHFLALKRWLVKKKLQKCDFFEHRWAKREQNETLALALGLYSAQPFKRVWHLNNDGNIECLEAFASTSTLYNSLKTNKKKPSNEDLIGCTGQAGPLLLKISAPYKERQLSEHLQHRTETFPVADS